MVLRIHPNNRQPHLLVDAGLAGRCCRRRKTFEPAVVGLIDAELAHQHQKLQIDLETSPGFQWIKLRSMSGRGASVNAAMSIRSSIITRVSACIELAYISSVDGARYGRPAPVVPLLPPIPVAADWPAQTRDIGKHNTPSPTQSAAVEIPGTGISSEQEHRSLCSRCAAVDLDNIVSLQLHGRLHFVMDLDATKIAKTKTFCSFCSLLSEVQPPPFGGKDARLTLCAIATISIRNRDQFAGRPSINTSNR